jgi:hypothetical protein
MGCVDCSDTAGWRGSWRSGVGATEIPLDAHALELVMTNTDRLAQALRIVRDWILPDSQRKWPDGRPMSYGDAFGSTGESQYMRTIAAEALAEHDTLASLATAAVEGDAVERALNARVPRGIFFRRIGARIFPNRAQRGAFKPRGATKHA